MCTYYYLHYHHLAPCTRPIDIALSYAFCQDATSIISSSEQQTTTTSTAAGSRASSSGQQQQPCQELYFDPSNSVMDCANPCVAGGCLASPECASGACRLEDLGGRWTCCACGRGGNQFRWCRHRKRKSPDTFCYHTCCHNCTQDAAATGGSGGGGDGAVA